MKLLYIDILNRLQRLIFPNICILCDDKKSAYHSHAGKNIFLDLCKDCQQLLPTLQNCCAHCASPLPLSIKTDNQDSQHQLICGACIKSAPPFTKVIAPYFYQAPVDHLITKLKFHKELVYGKILGTLLAEHLLSFYNNKDKPQVIIPIPLHKQRLKERGFNQSLEIAKPIAKTFGLPIDKYSCIRNKNTAPQSLLNAKERKKNIHGAFSIKQPFAWQYVAVVDDVITTGDTMKEFCQELQHVGVQRIDVWACAHA